jgi:hypothetical protein
VTIRDCKSLGASAGGGAITQWASGSGNIGLTLLRGWLFADQTRDYCIKLEGCTSRSS